MKQYDLIVIGSGAGLNVASNAHAHGMKVAVIEHGPLGGTCLNVGCIPSKVLIYPADVIRAMQDAGSLGVKSEVSEVDFGFIMERMHGFIDEDREQMEASIDATERFDWYRGTGEFVDDHTMRVGDATLTAPRIVIAAGSRAFTPSIKGLDVVDYLDNISVFELTRQPTSLILIGGGYIAVEFAHFFSAIGTKVTILGRNPRLLKEEDPEISALVKKRLGKHVRIHTGYEVFKIVEKGGKKVVYARNTRTKKVYTVSAEAVMVAAGRVSNADLFKPEKTGVETDGGGWIKVNEHLETTKPNIWALGDAIGKYLFRHTANEEAEIVWMNIHATLAHQKDGQGQGHGHKMKMNYHAIPHAVFGYPQVGAVGLTEPQVDAAGVDYLVGKAQYTDTAKGFAMGEDETLVKVLVDAGSRRVLGCHIAGPEAAVLVQQIVYLMHAGNGDYLPLARAEVIHPALSEVVTRAFGALMPPEHAHEGLPPQLRKQLESSSATKSHGSKQGAKRSGPKRKKRSGGATHERSSRARRGAHRHKRSRKS